MSFNIKEKPPTGYCYIYTLCNGDDNVRYVGFTNKSLHKRLLSHLNAARNSNKQNHRLKWLRKSLRDNSNIVINIIDTVLIEDWRFWEKYWISQFKVWGFNLTNATEGGDGTLGYKYTKEQLIHLSKVRRGFKHSKESLKLRSKEVFQLKLDGGFENMFCSIREAERVTRIKSGDIVDTCKGKANTAGGFSWCYIEDLLDFIPKLINSEVTAMNRKKVNQLSKEGKLIKTFNSASDAARQLKSHATSIIAVCKNKPNRKTCVGFKWEYA